MAEGSPQALHLREWLSALLRRAGLKPLEAGLLMAAVNLAADLPLALSFDAWSAGPKSRGLSGEPADWIYEFLVHPVILGYLVWLQTAGGQLLTELVGRAVPGSEDRLRRVLDKGRRRLQAWWVSPACMVLGLLFTIWFVRAFSEAAGPAPYPSWITVHRAIAWVRSPLVFVVFYALTLVIYHLIIITLTVSELLTNQEIRIEPFHPDRAGGLGFVGRFSANLGYLIGVLGLLLSIRMIQAPADFSDERMSVFLLGIVAYLVLAPTVFFLPLWAVHRAMANYRERLLADVSAKFDAALGQLQGLSGGSVDQVEGWVKGMQQLTNVRALIMDRVSVWPFSRESVRKYLGLAWSPLIPVVVPVILERVAALLVD
jgi:hypothetical protein